jgi:hypothetical protein
MSAVALALGKRQAAAFIHVHLLRPETGDSGTEI